MPKYACALTRFEALRWRTGRRSRAQLAAMDWSDDPTPVLDHLYLFGPAAADVVESPPNLAERDPHDGFGPLDSGVSFTLGRRE